ncbi:MULTISPECIES: tannase/feruloyl esterase family alpha/beta hydrolase [Microbacterium]|uniref:tannase/feruloyl esterase family alpha/beta hydrolase n=1 Tax=Microbacterium TaxID=33882 RepID=UPI0018E09D31|nr:MULTISPECIES: tannase/feruloyl esterase family alpha/beta hydrolase [Microbacterium]
MSRFFYGSPQGIPRGEPAAGRRRRRTLSTTMAAVAASVLLTAGLAGPASAAPPGGRDPLPQLSAAQPGTLQECETLTGFAYPATKIASVSRVAAGTVSNGGQPIGEHCLVRGTMNERVSAFDGQTYAIGFEMRLPVAWAGRYLYQGNGGLDGSVTPALGLTRGGESGLQMGFAVLSSDAGHSGAQNPLFGREPQARLDYGYQAVGTLTPMAEALITAAYDRAPDRSYITGGSNGGRHTMVAAARYADQYDGFLAIAPGFNLPQAAVAQLWQAQQWARVATNTADLNTAFTPQERTLVANAILTRCDGLDGLVDGMVQDSTICQRAFSVKRDVPRCDGDRDGTCLTKEQQAVIEEVFAGARTSNNKEIYSSFPFDPGLTQAGWAGWKFGSPYTRDAPAVGFIFMTPPEDPGILADLQGYALGFDVDTEAEKIYATSGIYTESSMSFMTPPDPTHLDTLRERGAKMIVMHGASDGVFSPDDTAAWFDELDRNYRGDAEAFARYFEVPGMGHVAGGPATDQHAGLAALVAWVEQGTAPAQLVASVNPANPEVPADWSPTRSRPLCVYPQVAQYISGDPENAASFACEDPHPGLAYGKR